MIKFRKKMKYLKGFILYALLCIFAFMPFMSFNTYAWSLDSNGNLVSDNLIPYVNNSYTSSGLSVSISNNGIVVNGTTASSGYNELLYNIDLTPGVYSFSSFGDVGSNSTYFSYIQGGGSILGRSYDTPFSFTLVNNLRLEYRIVARPNVSLNNVVFKDMLVKSSNYPNSFEPYKAVYYSESNMDTFIQSSYGAFAYASSIRLYYNNGSVTQLYKTYSNCYDMVLEDWCSFRNGSLNIDDYSLIFTTLGGNSNWSYNIGVDFSSSSIRVSTFKDWYFYGYSKFEFITYSNTYVLNGSYETMNPYVIDLTNNSLNNLNASDYIKSINYYRRNPNVGIAYGQFGTPNDSIYYNEGYNDGIDKGYDNGFDDGFTDGKDEGYTMGYNEGYRDGTTEDFTTNGFKTLIGSIFNYPINFIRSVFNFEFMGINISSIVFFVLSIGIVIFVIKRFKK